VDKRADNDVSAGSPVAGNGADGGGLPAMRAQARALRAELLRLVVAVAVAVALLPWAITLLLAHPALDAPIAPGRSPAVVFGGLLLATAAAVMAGRRLLRPWERLEQVVEPAIAPWSRRDLAWALGWCAFYAVILEVLRRAVNPGFSLVGGDAQAFLGNTIAILEGYWPEYNGDKRFPYPFLAAWAARLSGAPAHIAAPVVSQAFLSLLPGATWFVARAILDRLHAAIATGLLISLAALHPYGVQTSSYALFFLVCAVAVGLSIRALAEPSRKRYLWAGVGLAATVAVQEKGLTLIAPMLVLLTLRAAVVLRWRAGWPTVLACLPWLVHSLATYALPVQYTGLGWLSAIHREEVHREMKYPLPGTRAANGERPSPISPWLPELLRGSEIEQIAAVALTPADQNVIVWDDHLGHDKAVPREKPNTSIPPLSFRIGRNLEDLHGRLGGEGTTMALFLTLGTAAAALVSRYRRSVAAGALFVMLAMAIPPVTLKMHVRYVLCAAPAFAVLTTIGLREVARAALPAAPRVAAAWACFAGALLALRLWIPEVPARAHTLEAGASIPGLGSLSSELDVNDDGSYRAAAEWAAAHFPEPGAAAVLIASCTPIPLWYYREDSPAFLRREFPDGTPINCREVAQRGVPDHVRVAVSNNRDFRSVEHPDPKAFLDAPERWREVVAFDARGAEHAPGELWVDSPDTTWIFERAAR
jgi:hypothetical protein